MAAVTNEVIKIVQQFLKTIIDADIKIEKAILFGSCAKGKAEKWSDIDIAIISPDFSGISFYDSKKLIPFLLKVDTRIEPHPFRSEDFTEENLFVKEILKKGIEIKFK